MGRRCECSRLRLVPTPQKARGRIGGSSGLSRCIFGVQEVIAVREVQGLMIELPGPARSPGLELMHSLDGSERAGLTLGGAGGDRGATVGRELFCGGDFGLHGLVKVYHSAHVPGLRLVYCWVQGPSTHQIGNCAYFCRILLANVGGTGRAEVDNFHA